MKHIAAALMFFTRLPFWKLKSFSLPAEYYRQVVNYWAVAGWLTGGIMAATLWLSAQVLPVSLAVLLAIASRLITTGALHEDGFADFLDGFGGGTTKERILAIMKDSHIGVFGVIGLTIYFLLLHQTLSALPLHLCVIAILTGDPLCKFVGSQITLFLPYARNEETSKTKLVYKQMSFKAFSVSALFGLLPLLLIPNASWLAVILVPLFVFVLMIALFRKKLNGYTGDCCGALFIICELSYYLGVLLLYSIVRA